MICCFSPFIWILIVSLRRLKRFMDKRAAGHKSSCSGAGLCSGCSDGTRTKPQAGSDPARRRPSSSPPRPLWNAVGSPRNARDLSGKWGKANTPSVRDPAASPDPLGPGLQREVGLEGTPAWVHQTGVLVSRYPQYSLGSTWNRCSARAGQQWAADAALLVKVSTTEQDGSQRVSI